MQIMFDGWCLFNLLVCSGLWMTYFVTGLSLGAPAVLIPQLRRDANSTAAVSDEMASWLSSAFTYSTIPWVIILPLAMPYFSRKVPFIFACCASVAGSVMFYTASTIAMFLISQVLQGILLASNLTVSIILLTEYTSPEYRGIFLTLKSAILFWGMWAANAIGTYTHWNYIGLFGLVCSSYYATVFLWPESPLWLATRGRYKDCAKAHRWLKGSNKKSELELEKIIKSQREYLEISVKRETLRDRVMNFVKSLCCKEFYKPVSLSILIMAQYNASGKLVCAMYSIELIKRITDSESTAYTGMLILDGVSVAGMYVGCVLSKLLNRRTLLLITSAIGIVFLFIMSIYLWLVKSSVVVENKIVSISLLAAFSIAVSCGPMILSTSIYGELIPLRFKSSGVMLVVLMHFTFMGTSFKVAPAIFRVFSLPGTFLFYGLLCMILSIALYKYLPETKDRTLQEIEEIFKDNKLDDVRKELIEEKK